MTYETSADVLHKLTPGQKIWACAYEFDNNKKTMGLVQKPIYGVIVGDEFRPYFFIPFKNGSTTTLAKSKQVSIYARKFADTEEECIKLYNRLVKEKIDWFQNRIDETFKDYLLPAVPKLIEKNFCE